MKRWVSLPSRIRPFRCGTLTAGPDGIPKIDAPDLALERHTSFADRPLGEFLDFAAMVVAAINQALAKVPRERVRLHVC